MYAVKEIIKGLLLFGAFYAAMFWAIYIAYPPF